MLVSGMKVRVYRNLHKKCLSVQAKVNGAWKVIDHVDQITLVDVSFKVSQAGRDRVLREKRKNVHAYVCGTVATFPIALQGRKVSYNPYKADTFTETLDGHVYPVLGEQGAVVTTTGITI
jgi:hypothetical protein